MSKWRLALRLLGPLLFLWILTKVDLRLVMEALRGTTVYGVVAAALLVLAIILVKAVRWHRLLKKLGYRESYWTSLLVNGEAHFWGTLTPGRIGEFQKVVHLNRRHGISYFRGVWLNVLDRLFDALAIVVVFSVAALQLPAHVQSMFKPMFFIIMMVAFFSAVLLRDIWVQPLIEWSQRRKQRIFRALEAVLRDWAILSLGSTIEMLTISVISLLLYILVIAVLQHSLPFELTFSQTAICVSGTMLAGFLPISFFNFGTREVVLITFFHAFGLTRANAVSLSLLFVLCYLILLAVSACFWWLARRGIHTEPSVNASQTPPTK